MEPVRYGIIGTGQMGRGHTACLTQMESACLLAGADPHEESLSAFCEMAGPGVEAYESYRQLLERDDIEAVVIAAPDYTHVDIASHATVVAKPPRGIEKYSHNGGVYLEHLEFIECIRTGRKPLTGLEEARFSTLVGLAAEESARSGGSPVTL